MKTSMNPLRIAIVLLAVAVLVVLAINIVRPGPDTGSLYDEAPPDADWVLFVGNSHTYVNDLPGMVQRIAHFDEGAPPIWTGEHTLPGAHLMQHTENADLLEGIRTQGIEAVILQGAGWEPFAQPDEFIAAYRQVANLAIEGGTRPILFEIWTHASHSPIYDEPGFPQTPEQAAQVIEELSREATADLDAEVAPVGRAWEYHRRSATGIDLYAADGNHASPAGTYLSALVIYGSLRQKTLPTGLWHPRGVSESDAEILIGVANSVLGL